jgi:hypothetical protein
VIVGVAGLMMVPPRHPPHRRGRLARRARAGRGCRPGPPCFIFLSVRSPTARRGGQPPSRRPRHRRSMDRPACPPGSLRRPR